MHREGVVGIVVLAGLVACSDPKSVHLLDAAADGQGPCSFASDCGDTAAFACDPDTRKCVATNCDTTMPCPSGQYCIRQASGSGLCRPSCSVNAGCPSGQTCVFSGTSGLSECLATGPSPLGGMCQSSDVTTGCAEGTCHNGLCVAVCDPFGTASPCPSDKLCSAFYDCSLPATIADPSAVSQFCTTKDVPCATDNGLERGFCITIYNVNICRKGCRLDVPGDCAPGTTCVQPPPIDPTGNLGVCEPALDASACVDGGTGTCAACVTAEEGSGGCCESQNALCTTQGCRDFVTCAIACKRGKACVDACIAADTTAAQQGTPLFLCLSGYGAPPGGACGDVCGGQPVCGNYDGPDTASTCTTCPATTPGCRANGCFNGFYCDRTTNTCTAPSNVPNCAN